VGLAAMFILPIRLDEESGVEQTHDSLLTKHLSRCRPLTLSTATLRTILPSPMNRSTTTCSGAHQPTAEQGNSDPVSSTSCRGRMRRAATRCRTAPPVLPDGRCRLRWLGLPDRLGPVW